MSIDIIVEVMEHAPASLTAAERYALLVLAEDARMPSREVQHDIDDEYLLRRLRLSAASWANTRSSLVRKKVLEKVGGGHNGRRAKYRIPEFADAMKVHRSGEPTGASSSTDSVNLQEELVHRSGESRFTDSVKCTYITPVSPTTTPRPAADKPGEGEGKSTSNERARSILAALPPTHAVGRGRHDELLTAITQLLDLGHPANRLEQLLTEELPARTGSVAAVLINRLPVAAPYRPPATGQPAAAKPPHCGNPNCDPRTRTLEDPDTGRPTGKCPTCHPDAQKATP
jgi:hypothetical protein